MIALADVIRVAERIREHVVRTPTVASPGLSALLGAPTVVKLESLQRTGSFKARGVTAKLLSLTAAERDRGVVTVSGGNHGIALAMTARDLGIDATVVMPRSAPARAIALAEGAGATVRVTADTGAAFALVTRLNDSGMTLVHPFDDPVVLAGQGTVGLELAHDATRLTDVLVSIGGGGLISGVATAVRGLLPQVRIWGVEVGGGDAMTRALSAGHPVTFEPSSAVSTLNAPTVSQLAYDHVTSLVEDVLVTTGDEAIRGAFDLAEHGNIWAEPAAGCLIPAARDVVSRIGGDCRLGLVVCGGNVALSEFTTWHSTTQVPGVQPLR
ncbi:pyridoxal-phosphate dependent enzyme [Streptomyces sp. NPDC004838]